MFLMCDHKYHVYFLIHISIHMLTHTDTMICDWNFQKIRADLVLSSHMFNKHCVRLTV